MVIENIVDRLPIKIPGDNMNTEKLFQKGGNGLRMQVPKAKTSKRLS